MESKKKCVLQAGGMDYGGDVGGRLTYRVQ